MNSLEGGTTLHCISFSCAASKMKSTLSSRPASSAQAAGGVLGVDVDGNVGLRQSVNTEQRRRQDNGPGKTTVLRAPKHDFVVAGDTKVRPWTWSHLIVVVMLDRIMSFKLESRVSRGRHINIKT